MISDDLKVREMAEAYFVIAKSSAYYTGIWNSKEIAFTKDDKIMPLFIGSVVYAKKNEEICGIVSFNQKEQKCEISHAYPDLDEDTVWKPDYGRYGCMADKDLTVSRIDAGLASDLRDSERAFDLIYGEVISCLNNPEAAGFSETECSAFRKDIRSCVFMNRFIYRSTDGEYRCQCMDGIIEKSIGKAMETMMREDPAAYGVGEGAVDFNADFVEKVYGGFKRIFQCFYPRIQW